MDSNDEIVAGADDRITFSIEGNGTIVGVDNGDPTNTDSYKGHFAQGLPWQSAGHRPVY